MAQDLTAITAILRQYIADVKKAMPIDKVYLYGSYAKGTQRDDSDVDICFFSNAFTSRRTLDVLTDLFYSWRGFNTQEPACAGELQGVLQRY